MPVPSRPVDVSQQEFLLQHVTEWDCEDIAALMRRVIKKKLNYEIYSIFLIPLSVKEVSSSIPGSLFTFGPFQGRVKSED